MKCRMEDCFTQKLQRFGLCNKHRKWVEKGYMTQDLKMIKNPPRVGSYKGMRCRIPECDRTPRRNLLCSYHSSQYRAGTLLLSGNRVYKKVLRYSKQATCKVHRCERGGKITKGFCKKHYNSYRKELIDFDGFETGKRKRITRYLPEDRCKVSSCKRRPRGRGFCNNHLQSFLRGMIDPNGKRLVPLPIKNKGELCSYEGCGKPAHCKTYCHLHYSRYVNCKSLDDPETVNKGKTCAQEGCGKPAYVKGYCTVHYSRLMRGKPLDIPPETRVS